VTVSAFSASAIRQQLLACQVGKVAAAQVVSPGLDFRRFLAGELVFARLIR
jgi:hypothetical protein